MLHCLNSFAIGQSSFYVVRILQEIKYAFQQKILTGRSHSDGDADQVAGKSLMTL